MATNYQLKFFKGASAPATPIQGMIWFCTSDRTIRVYTGAEWEKYAGLVNAEWNETDKKLNLTSANGTVTTLDLSDMASAQGIAAEILAINNTLTAHDTAIKAADAKAAGAQTHSEGVAGSLATEVQERKDEISRVAGLISAEETRAKAAEEANAAAAEAADDKAVAAQSYAEGVNTALGAEVTRATNKENELAGKITTLEQAVGTGGSVDSKIAEALGTLDTPEAGVTGDGTFVDVTVKQVDGVITEVSVAENDIASAQALASEIGRATAAEEGLAGRLAELDAANTGRVSILEEQVRALNAATHFEGVVAWNPVGDNKVVEGYDAGDIVVYGNKEFIFDGTNWIELGDTTEEGNRISALESLVGSVAVQTQISNAVSALDADITSTEGQNVTVQVIETDGKIVDVVVSENDIASAAKLSEVESEVDLNTAAVADYKTRIEALESTSGQIDAIYVKVANYNVDKAAFEQKDTNLQNEIDAAEGRLDTVEAAIERLDGEQDAQDLAISAADAKGAQGIADAAAALAEAQTKVASVTGDADVNATGTTAVTLSLNKATTVAAGDTKAVTSGAVYEALCWAEFN